LRADEMTPTLQDVSMILGLPIQGEPLCMNIASDGWRQQMEGLIGLAPLEPEDRKDRAPTGASFLWIKTNFGTCPEGANRDTIKTYTRVYLWYMISRTLFLDSGGKLAHWCWLKALMVLEHQWSWGSAALAYLYRQVMVSYLYYSSIVVCGTCHPWTNQMSYVRSWTKVVAGLGATVPVDACSYFPYGAGIAYHLGGRRDSTRGHGWIGSPLGHIYIWDNVSEMTNDPIVMYMHYTEELNTLTSEHVTDFKPSHFCYPISSISLACCKF
jgi:hypothetical protein